MTITTLYACLIQSLRGRVKALTIFSKNAETEVLKDEGEFLSLSYS